MPGPYLTPTVDTFREWGADVRDVGGIVTVVPSGPNRGAYAARFPAEPHLPPDAYVYVLAPLAVLAWQFGQMAQEEYDRRAGEFVEYIEGLGSRTADTIGDALGGLGSAVGGIVGKTLAGWWWLVVLGGVGLYAYANRGKLTRGGGR